MSKSSKAGAARKGSAARPKAINTVMRTKKLGYVLDVTLSDEQFDAFVDLFSSRGRTAVSRIALKSLAVPLGMGSEHAKFSANPTWSRYFKPERSEVFLSPREVLIVDEPRTPGSLSHRSATLIGAGSVRSRIELQAFGPDYISINQLLTEAVSSVFSALGGQAPEPAMVDPGSMFYVKREREQNAERLLQLRGGASFAAAAINDDDLVLAKYMMHDDLRQLVLRLVATRRMPEAKFEKEVSAVDPDGTFVKCLLAGGYLTRETVVSCRKTNQQVARFGQDDVDLSVLSLRCAHCDRLYTNELRTTDYVVTHRLRQIVQSSMWMSILISSMLIHLGVAIENIYWNVQFGSDEIDVICFVDGQMWAFELKDKEFGKGDAHQFNLSEIDYPTRRIFCCYYKCSIRGRKASVSGCQPWAFSIHFIYA